MKLYMDETLFRRLQRPDAFVLRPVEGPDHTAEWPEPPELQGLTGPARRLALDSLAETLSPYVVYDASRGCTGFGIKVTKNNATVVVQRRVRSGTGGGNVIRPTVGKAGDYRTLKNAWDAARQMADDIKKHRKNPKKILRDDDARDVTLKAALDEYRAHLKGRRNKPAKPNTIANVDKAIANLASLHSKRLSDLGEEDVLALFDKMALGRGIVTTAEQTMRWGSVSVKRAIAQEAARAEKTKSRAVFSTNPFGVLVREGMYRTKAQLETSYAERGVRNPLRLNDTLGPWLKGICGRRKENRTGCDYLILATLWGCRKGEALDLKWLDLIDADQVKTSSYVDLANRLVFFRDTKNRLNHKLPLGLGAYRILAERRAMANEFKDTNPQRDPSKRVYVFPARSTSSLSKTNYYKGPRSLTLYVCKDIGYIKTTVTKNKAGNAVTKEVAAISMHDLRCLST